jgi:hypothetical protein
MRPKLWMYQTPEDRKFAWRVTKFVTLFYFSLAALAVAYVYFFVTPNGPVGAQNLQADSRPSPKVQCARRDNEIFTQIEKLGDNNSVAPERLAAAAQKLQDAREACAAGLVDTGLAIYDDIAVRHLDLSSAKSR